jgi:hypothetical protein
MLFDFKKKVQINFKPEDKMKRKFFRKNFEKGLAVVPQEVLDHPYFKKIVLRGVAVEQGKKSFEVEEVSEKKSASSSKAKNNKVNPAHGLSENVEVEIL